MSLLLRRRNTCERFQKHSSNNKVKQAELVTSSLNCLIEVPCLNNNISESTSSLISFDSVVGNEETMVFTERALRRELYIRKTPRLSFGVELIAIESEIFVACVNKNSMAFKAGLKFGDQIVAVADKDVSTFNGVEHLKSFMDSERRFVLNIVDFPHKKTFSMDRSKSFENWGITLEDHEITVVETGSPADFSGVPVGYGLIEVNGVNVLLDNQKRIINLMNKGKKKNKKTVEISVMDLSVMKELYAYLSSVVIAKMGEAAAVKNTSSSGNLRDNPLEISSSLQSLNSVL